MAQVAPSPSVHLRVPLPDSQLHFSGQPYSVSVLRVGYSLPQPDGTVRADGTVSLITGPKVVLVDTGGPWARDELLLSLSGRGVDPGSVDWVIGTHGHSDHIGNINLFPAASLVVGYDVSAGDTYRPNGLARGEPLFLDEHLRVVPTPGHSGQDVSVQLKDTSVGTILIAGDLFECCTDEDKWRELSANVELQEVHRQAALHSSQVIVPGHGRPFQVLAPTEVEPQEHCLL